MADRSGRSVVQLSFKDHRTRSTTCSKTLYECGSATTISAGDNHPWATQKKVSVRCSETGLVAPRHWVTAAEANVARRSLARDPHLC